MSSRLGPPRHRNKFAWKAHAAQKINESEPGGKFRPFPEITGVCRRCKDQIEWKRKYGKYKPLTEAAKCQKCSKRAVRQAYYSVCPGCAKDQRICAKCCCRVDQLIGRDSAEVEAEQKMLEEAIKNARERERRTLLRAMNKEKPKGQQNKVIQDGKVEGLFSSMSLDEYASLNRDEDEEGDEDEDAKIISLNRDEHREDVKFASPSRDEDEDEGEGEDDDDDEDDDANEDDDDEEEDEENVKGH